MNAGPGKNGSSLFAARFTDHLQIGHPQVTILFFASCLLHLAFLLFLCFFLCFRLVMNRTGDRYLMADVFVKLNGPAAQVPGLSVFSYKGKNGSFVAFLQTAGYGLDVNSLR